MTDTRTPQTDLTISRIIKAPRPRVWNAWADPQNLMQWWIPAPTLCRIVEFDLRPGGGFRTEMSDNAEPFVSHLSACFLEIGEGQRIVFTNFLTGGWRPAEQGLITAIISFADHPEGTAYSAYVMHRNAADRGMHEELGFYDGWGTVAAQMAAFAERPD